MNTIAVVIVNWNSWTLLLRCMEALAAQTYRDFSVTIIDNASSDEMPLEILVSYPQIRLVRSTINLGFAAGNNLAFEKYTGGSEWIALLNADAVAEPDWLEALMAGAKANPEFDAFGSKLLDAANPLLLDGEGDVYHLSGRIWREGRSFPASKHVENEREVFSPCGAAALYRRSAVMEVGGFDEDYFCYAEDVDLGFRLRLAGYRCLYVPQSIVHHISGGSTGGQHSDFSVYHGHRNLVWTFVKDMPGILFYILAPLHVALNLGSMFYLLFRGQGRVIVRAKWDALVGLPKMWRKRRQIQKARVASVGDIWRMLDKRLIPIIRQT